MTTLFKFYENDDQLEVELKHRMTTLYENDDQLQLEVELKDSSEEFLEATKIILDNNTVAAVEVYFRRFKDLIFLEKFLSFCDDILELRWDVEEMSDDDVTVFCNFMQTSKTRRLHVRTYPDSSKFLQSLASVLITRTVPLTFFDLDVAFKTFKECMSLVKLLNQTQISRLCLFDERSIWVGNDNNTESKRYALHTLLMSVSKQVSLERLKIIGFKFDLSPFLNNFCGNCLKLLRIVRSNINFVDLTNFIRRSTSLQSLVLECSEDITRTMIVPLEFLLSCKNKVKYLEYCGMQRVSVDDLVRFMDNNQAIRYLHVDTQFFDIFSFKDLNKILLQNGNIRHILMRDNRIEYQNPPLNYFAYVDVKEHTKNNYFRLCSTEKAVLYLLAIQRRHRFSFGLLLGKDMFQLIAQYLFQTRSDIEAWPIDREGYLTLARYHQTRETLKFE